MVKALIAIAMKLWCIKRYTNSNANINYKDRQLFKEIVAFSGWTTVLSLSQRLIFTIAPTILGIYSGSIPIAIFGIAVALESYVYSFSTVFSGMFLPKVSRIIRTGDGNLMPIMIKVGRIQLMIVGAIVMGFICLGKHFIGIWVGDGFEESFICTVLLILPSLVQLPQEIGMQAIVAENKVKQQAYVYMIMAAFNIVFSFILAKYYGAVGVSVSICIAYFIRTVGFDLILKYELHLDLKEFFSKTFIGLSCAILVVSTTSYLLNLFFSDFGILPFLFKAVVFLRLYVMGLDAVSNAE